MNLEIIEDLENESIDSIGTDYFTSKEKWDEDIREFCRLTGYSIVQKSNTALPNVNDSVAFCNFLRERNRKYNQAVMEVWTMASEICGWNNIVIDKLQSKLAQCSDNVMISGVDICKIIADTFSFNLTVNVTKITNSTEYREKLNTLLKNLRELKEDGTIDIDVKILEK